MRGAQLHDLPCRPGHHPGHPADRGDQLGDGVLGRHRIRQDRRVHRPSAPALQHPGLRDHRRDRVIDPVRAIQRASRRRQYTSVDGSNPP